MKTPVKHKQALADFAITSQILGALKTNPQIPVDNVEVVTRKGCVTVKGMVQWDFQEEIVSEVVKNMAGVKKMRNFIAVCPETNYSSIWTYSAN